MKAQIDWTNDEEVVRAALEELPRTRIEVSETPSGDASVWINELRFDAESRQGCFETIRSVYAAVNIFEQLHRPVTEGLEDLMRDTTDAVRGEEPRPKCGVPQYAGSNLCTLDAGHGGDHECARGAMIHCWPKGVRTSAVAAEDAFEAQITKFRHSYQNGVALTAIERDIAGWFWNAALQAAPGGTKVTKPPQYDECYAELRRHLSNEIGVGIMAVRPEVLSRVLDYHDALVEARTKHTGGQA